MQLLEACPGLHRRRARCAMYSSALGAPDRRLRPRCLLQGGYTQATLLYVGGPVFLLRFEKWVLAQGLPAVHACNKEHGNGSLVAPGFLMDSSTAFRVEASRTASSCALLPPTNLNLYWCLSLNHASLQPCPPHPRPLLPRSYLVKRYDDLVRQVPLMAVHTAGRGSVPADIYTPPPLRSGGHGWHPEW